MSILLEALKKSEAQRQLGATPTLQTPAGMATTAQQLSRGRWVVAGMMVVAVCAMTWLGWSQFRPAEVERSQVAAAKAPPETPELSTAGPAADSGNAEEQAMDDILAEPRTLVSMGAQSGNAGEDAEEKRRLLGKSFRAYAPEKAVAAENAEAGQAQPVGPSTPAGANDDGATALVADSANAMQRARQAETPRDATISYWQIPSSLRQGMPELHIRVLVYAERPEDRFLLLNELRLREGDEVESGLRLEEIQRDRAIFTYRNYRFHLKG